MTKTEQWTAEQWHQAKQEYFKVRQSIQTQLVIKRILDIIVSSIGLIILSPVLAIIAIAIRLTSPGPILFLQERSGQFGEPFYIYKFRTMIDGAIHVGAGLSTFDGDPRITSVGKFLREYHLDELPQLWNVLCGEMSLVGPRPLLTSFLSTYNNWEKRRLLMPPGITAWEAVMVVYSIHLMNG